MRKQDNKMIEVRVRFWTNNLAPDGKVSPKRAWDCGMVNIAASPLHGIPSNHTLPFHSLLDLGRVIERALIEQGIVLQTGRRTSKYIGTKAK